MEREREGGGELLKLLRIPGDHARFESNVYPNTSLDGIDIESNLVMLISYGYPLTSEPSQGRADRRGKSLSRTQRNNGCTFSSNISSHRGFFFSLAELSFLQTCFTRTSFLFCFSPRHCDLMYKDRCSVASSSCNYISPSSITYPADKWQILT